MLANARRTTRRDVSPLRRPNREHALALLGPVPGRPLWTWRVLGASACICHRGVRVGVCLYGELPHRPGRRHPPFI